MTLRDTVTPEPLMARLGLKAYVRSSAKQLLGQRLTDFVRAVGTRNLASIEAYRKHLRGKRALEIGGPSEIFQIGPLRIYSVLASIDNCNYSAHTIWRSTGRIFGRNLVCEATNLQGIADGRYDCVLSSHSLEHSANPLKALYEWKRVLTKDGILLLILPNKENTFDWRRPVTSLDHMISDYERQTGEDDLFHLDEILALHDLSRDAPAGTPEQFRVRCLNNLSIRAIHHHVFSRQSTLELVKYAGFLPILSELNQPNDIIVLARRQ